MLYILLFILAVGVLLLSLGGQSLLVLLLFLAIVAGILFLVIVVGVGIFSLLTGSSTSIFSIVAVAVPFLIIIWIVRPVKETSQTLISDGDSNIANQPVSNKPHATTLTQEVNESLVQQVESISSDNSEDIVAVNISEAEIILQEVNKRRKKANNKGLPVLVWSVFESIKIICEWFASDHGEWVPSFIQEARCDYENDLSKNYTIKMNNHTYKIESRTINSEIFDRIETYFQLNLLRDGSLVFSLKKYFLSPGPIQYSIAAYIEGAWEGNFRQLKKELEAKIIQIAVNVSAEKSRKEDLEKIVELKEKFGVF